MDLLKRGIFQKTADGKGALFEQYAQRQERHGLRDAGAVPHPGARHDKAPDS